MLKEIIGYILIFGGIIDSWKYLWHIQAIKKVQTAKSHSRKFVNAAIIQDLIKLLYGIVIKDFFIIISSVLALITMSLYFYNIYLYYPYRCRGLVGFKRPNIFLYFINSLLPNSIRKRL